MSNILLRIGLVALGSAIGGVARWSIGLVAARILGTAFPFGTLLINLSGCLFLGWFLIKISETEPETSVIWIQPDNLRLAIAVGFLGAFTTFSTFEWELHALVRDGNRWAATFYIFGSLFFGFLAIRFGTLLARYL